MNKSASELAKLGHKKSPRPVEFYKEMAKKSWEARRKKKK